MKTHGSVNSATKAITIANCLFGIGLFITVNSHVRAAGLTFTDWTNVDTSNEVAEGTFGPVTVTLSGGDLGFFYTNGGFTGFNYPFFHSTDCDD